jgi:4a-hydroxytetrahydrobiopterin dehydratase
MINDKGGVGSADMADLLEADALLAALAALDGWTGDPSALSRTVELASFPAAITVVNQVAAVAEDLDHHPDIDIRWRTLTFRLSTHSAGGVTRRDVELAERIDEIVAKRG